MTPLLDIFKRFGSVIRDAITPFMNPINIGVIKVSNVLPLEDSILNLKQFASMCYPLKTPYLISRHCICSLRSLAIVIYPSIHLFILVKNGLSRNFHVTKTSKMYLLRTQDLISQKQWILEHLETSMLKYFSFKESCL